MRRARQSCRYCRAWFRFLSFCNERPTELRVTVLQEPRTGTRGLYTRGAASSSQVWPRGKTGIESAVANDFLQVRDLLAHSKNDEGNGVLALFQIVYLFLKVFCLTIELGKQLLDIHLGLLDHRPQVPAKLVALLW